jgi:hypothetical protein
MLSGGLGRGIGRGAKRASKTRLKNRDRTGTKKYLSSPQQELFFDQSHAALSAVNKASRPVGSKCL